MNASPATSPDIHASPRYCSCSSANCKTTLPVIVPLQDSVDPWFVRFYAHRVYQVCVHSPLRNSKPPSPTGHAAHVARVDVLYRWIVLLPVSILDPPLTGTVDKTH